MDSANMLSNSNLEHFDPTSGKARKASEPMKRRSLSKKVRFAVFARDGFACRYCGAQSDKVQLVVDHVVPVCQGGSDEPENLITACFPCNAGKGGQTIQQAAPTEAHRLALAQEMQEQMAALTAAREASEARKRLEQEVCNYFCRSRGTNSMDRSTLQTLTSYVFQHGAHAVFQWIDIAVGKLSPGVPDGAIGRYVSGIRRKEMEDGHA